MPLDGTAPHVDKHVGRPNPNRRSQTQPSVDERRTIDDRATGPASLPPLPRLSLQPICDLRPICHLKLLRNDTIVRDLRPCSRLSPRRHDERLDDGLENHRPVDDGRDRLRLTSAAQPHQLTPTLRPVVVDQVVAVHGSFRLNLGTQLVPQTLEPPGVTAALPLEIGYRGSAKGEADPQRSARSLASSSLASSRSPACMSLRAFAVGAPGPGRPRPRFDRGRCSPSRSRSANP